MNGADYVVRGLAPYPVVLDDLMMDVPCGHTLTIPADKASNSRDLHLAISQNRLLWVNRHMQVGRSVDYEQLRARCQILEDENRRLREEVRVLKAAPPAAPLVVGADPRFEEILVLLKSGVAQSPRALPVETALAKTREVQPDVVEVEVPQYIPDRVVPEGAGGGRVIIPEQTSTASGVGQAQEALRKLRSGQ